MSDEISASIALVATQVAVLAVYLRLAYLTFKASVTVSSLLKVAVLSFFSGIASFVVTVFFILSYFACSACFYTETLADRIGALMFISSPPIVMLILFAFGLLPIFPRLGYGSDLMWMMCLAIALAAYLFGGGAVPDSLMSDSPWVLLAAVAGGLVGLVLRLAQMLAQTLHRGLPRMQVDFRAVLLIAAWVAVGAVSASMGLLLGSAMGRATDAQRQQLSQISRPDLPYEHFGGDIEGMLLVIAAGLLTAVIVGWLAFRLIRLQTERGVIYPSSGRG